MAMTTRCPQCGTAFKVVPDQLRVRNGLVRCGACATVFDGRACLVAQIPQAGSAQALAPARNAVPPVRAELPAPADTADAADAPDTAFPALSSSPPADNGEPAHSVPFVPSVPSAASGASGASGASAPPATSATSVPQAGPAPAPLRSAPPAPVLTDVRPARAEPSLAGASPAVLRGRSDIRRHDPYVGQPPPQQDEDWLEDEPAREDDEPVAWHGAATIGSDAAAGAALPPAAGAHAADADANADANIANANIANAAAAAAAVDDDDTKARAAADDDLHVSVGPTVLGEARTRYYGATDVGRSPPEFLDTDQQQRRHLVRSLWGYACVVGLLLLALQLVFVYRSAIANAAPALRPLLTSLCQPLGCEIGYARRIERIFITSSSLQPPRGQAGAPAQDDRRQLVLRVSLRNRYDQPQHWPALLLDLTDLSDTVVVRKVLRPADYLPEGQAQRPFEPGAEINIAVPIEVAGVRVNGYQLDKFFP